MHKVNATKKDIWKESTKIIKGNRSESCEDKLNKKGVEILLKIFFAGHWALLCVCEDYCRGEACCTVHFMNGALNFVFGNK